MLKALKNKRLIDATFEDMEMFLDSYIEGKGIAEPKTAEHVKLRGLKAIAEFLKMSEKTLSRLRKETHIFDEVIRQKGRIITADTAELTNVKI